MKYILSILFSIFGLFFLIFTPDNAYSQGTSLEGKWVGDQEVTFVGKTAARANEFLNWTLQNYDWVCVQKTTDNRCDNSNNPLRSFWVLVRNVVYVLIALFVLVSAFVIVITRGQNLTVMKFIPRFVIIAVLIYFSFSLVQFIYQMSDWLQGWLLKPGNEQITSKDLLFIGFEYKDFTGFRRVGAEFEESAFMSLLLVRLTAFTYYVMTGVLLIRKIILWFFIIVSPVFPLLFFYSPIKNTAKIWIGEFFRWLLYGPLFALFLFGLVNLWQKSPNGIPLPFSFPQPTEDTVVYPTAVNILLAGPGQSTGLFNSVNVRDTFALYVVALLMLWVVILLPFLLLNVFLDYIQTISIKNNTLFQRALNRFGWTGARSTPPIPLPPPAAAPTGLARPIPVISTGATASSYQLSSRDVRALQADIASIRATAEMLRTVNVNIPKMRDIAKYESSLLRKDISHSQEVTRLHSTLERLANPSSIATIEDRERFNTVREKLVVQKQKGDPLAASVLTASATISKKRESQSALAPQAGKAGVTTLSGMSLPVVNHVQQVSLEDYEEVKKMWKENYQTLEPPHDLSGKDITRQEWIKTDIEKVNEAIALLISIDTQRNNQGMEMVASILPFLLIGGFSKTEVVAYLKAKLEAAKSALEDMGRQQEEEETTIAVGKKKEEKGQEEVQHEALPTPGRNDKNSPEDKMFELSDKNKYGGGLPPPPPSDKKE